MTKAQQDTIAELLKEQYRHDINEFLPGEIALTKKLIRKHPALKDQGKDYIFTCQSLMLQIKNEYRRL